MFFLVPDHSCLVVTGRWSIGTVGSGVVSVDFDLRKWNQVITPGVKPIGGFSFLFIVFQFIRAAPVEPLNHLKLFRL